MIVQPFLLGNFSCAACAQLSLGLILVPESASCWSVATLDTSFSLRTANTNPNILSLFYSVSEDPSVAGTSSEIWLG